MNLSKAALTIALLISQYGTAQTSNQDIVIGHKANIESKVLGETREIWISKPRGDTKSSTSRAVLYLLDGDSNFRHTTAIAEFLASSNRIPELLVVGILNTDRGRDLTPHSSSQDDLATVRTLGGANNFQVFFEDELFPFIEENHNTHPYRILIGHSLGGLFAIHTLTTRPELFNAYIAISPSLRWSDQALVTQAEQYFSSISSLPVDVYLTYANEGGESLSAIRKLSGILGEYSPQGFRWQFKHMPEEHHGSVALRSTYYGLESIFNGWSTHNALETYQIGGVDAVRRQYREGGQRFGYNRTLSNISLLQIANQLINLTELDDATRLVTEELDVTPPSYFLNLLADKYEEAGEPAKAVALYKQSLANNPSDQASKSRLEELGVDVSQIVNTVTVSTETLASYEGQYQLQPGFVLTIFLEGAKLYTQGTGQRATDLVPITDKLFSVTDGDAQMEFVRNGSGEVERLVLHQAGMEMAAPRIKD